MKTLLLFVAVALLCCGLGCRLTHNGWLTTIAEPIHYPRNVDEKLSEIRFRDMAAAALEEARATARAELDDYECEPFSVGYQEGFIDGFVDYLMAGGTGTPPPLPPRRYWRGRFQNPLGHQLIADWFAGYEHGAGLARTSNYRTFVTVPVSDAIVSGTMQNVYGRISASAPGETSDQASEFDDQPSNVADDEIVEAADPPQRLDTGASVSRLQRVGRESERPGEAAPR
jgi:hypothetical protein